MAELNKITDSLEKIAEIAAILEPQLNYSREYQFYLEYIRKNWDMLPDEVPDGTYFYGNDGVRLLFTSVFRVCGCQVGNIVSLEDLEAYLGEVKNLAGQMKKESNEIRFDQPAQRY